MKEDPAMLIKNILATIVYYDIFSYPLTSFEIWKYLVRSDYYSKRDPAETSYLDVRNCLRSEKLRRFIGEKQGFYFIKSKEHLVEERIKKNKISVSKLRRIKKYMRFLSFVPFVRMVAVTGGLAMKNGHPKSDWDLFIVLKSGKIWTGRTAVTAVLHLLGKRRHGKKIKDRFCLNYFVSEDGLEITTKDLFSSSEYYFMLTLLDLGALRRFQLKNRWIKDIRPNYHIADIPPASICHDSGVSKTIRKFGEFILAGGFIEDFLRKIEKDKIMRNPKTHKEGGLVSASDKALIFLPELKGPIVFDRFKAKIDELVSI